MEEPGPPAAAFSVTAEPTDPQRFRAFATFFKGYMNVATLVVAALPVPATQLQLIPTVPFLTGMLSLFTSLFCFLTLSFIFYSRYGFANAALRHHRPTRGRIIAIYVPLT